MSRLNLRLFLLLPALLAVAACSSKDDASQAPPEAATAKPAAAIMAQVKLLKAGNFDALAQTALTPADYQALRKEFKQQKQDKNAPTDKQRKEFAAKMELLTGPDAEQNVWQKVQPMLEQYDSKYKPLLPMYVGMGKTVMTTAIAGNEDLNAAQKQQATQLMDTLGSWVQNTPWGDTEKAKKAISIVVATARDLDIKTLDQARALDYDQAVRKYATFWAGMRKVAAVYGLNINQTLNSIQASTIQQDGPKATVQVDYELLGEPQIAKVHMVKRDGHWYNESLLDAFTEQPAAAASVAAPASVVPAAAASVGTDASN